MISIISHPNNEINTIINVPPTLRSYRIVKDLWIDVSLAPTDEYIEITYNGETVTLLITDECRYTPIDIFFQNKEGAQQSLTFFKSSTETLSISKDSFESDRGQPLAGNHQFIDFNVNGKTKLKVNSGFVTEDLNETFRQLLLSQRVWKFDNGIFTPLNVSSSSLEYKNRQKDRLINYEIEFDYSLNEINNV